MSAQSNINIPGVSVETGLRNSGGEEPYLRLIKDIYNIIDDRYNQINEYLKTNDIVNYTVVVHSLKTNCRMLGALKLSDKFFTLERYGNENNIDMINTDTDSVLKELLELKKHLKDYIPNKNVEAKDYNVEEFKMLLDKLSLAIDDFDINSADKLINEIITYKTDDNLRASVNRLNKLISDLEYDEAATLIDKIKPD